VSEPNEAMLEMAERLTGMVEELTDMALAALSLAASGDPDSAEAGEALALERRVVRARRALEKAISVLSEGVHGSARGEATLDGGAA
jgi:hypothetical protein